MPGALPGRSTKFRYKQVMDKTLLQIIGEPGFAGNRNILQLDVDGVTVYAYQALDEDGNETVLKVHASMLAAIASAPLSDQYAFYGLMELGKTSTRYFQVPEALS
jgi:hypothetical protein